MDYGDKKDWANSTGEHVEVEQGRRKSTAEEVTELSSIEATAASKAAWLISITVSTGGFLFGMHLSSSVSMTIDEC